MRVLDTELLAMAVSALPNSGGLRETLTPAQRDRVTALVRHAFGQLAASGDLASDEISLDASGRFDSVLYGRKSGGMVVAYSFSGLMYDAAVPLFSAAIAFFTRTLGPSSASDAANSALALWRNLAVLREPADSDAIALVRATVAVRTQGSNFVNEHYPTTAEMAQEAGFDEERTVTALRNLVERKVMAVETWGGQNGDLSDPGNSWTFPL